MGLTRRFALRYIDRGESMRNTRAALQTSMETVDDQLGRVQDYAYQLASLLNQTGGPTGLTQTVIGLDTDGVPYFDPAASVVNPCGIGLDTDGTPYFVDWTPTP